MLGASDIFDIIADDLFCSEGLSDSAAELFLRDKECLLVPDTIPRPFLFLARG
jgi:hypothetical protein